MRKQVIQHAVKKESGVIKAVGKSYIMQPKVNYTGQGTKWFDDNQLINKFRVSGL